MFGSMLVQYAIIWHITLITQSGVYLTIATIAGFLPHILVSLFAGVWADRYPRKFLIIASDALIALSTLVLAIFFLLGLVMLLFGPIADRITIEMVLAATSALMAIPGFWIMFDRRPAAIVRVQDADEVGPVVGGMPFLPATPDVIAGFIREAQAAPDELSTILNVMPSPPMPFVP